MDCRCRPLSRTNQDENSMSLLRTLGPDTACRVQETISMRKTTPFRSMMLLDLNPQSFNALFTICALLLSSISANAEWRFAHADPANTSFARVNTNVARLPKLAETGPVAFGANR